MISRIQSFGRYHFDFEEYPAVRELFADPEFLSAGREVCPQDKRVLDPFQFNFIIQVPGQTVAAHIDGAYFWGATRFQYPQWLLAAMVFSGMWRESFVDQVQIVGYYHEWNSDDRDGEFVYWNDPDGSLQSIPPRANAGSAVDGSKVIHAATVYRPSVRPPPMDKNAVNVLEHVEDDRWRLRTFVGDKEREREYAYNTSDLRMSVVYRARCFESIEDRDRFAGNGGPTSLTLNEILSAFANDLVRRGRLKTSQDALDMPRIDFAMLIMSEYVTYPFGTSTWMPFNYCALGALSSALGMLVSPFCDT